MDAEIVQIDQLRLRVPGLDPTHAKLLGIPVAQRLAKSMRMSTRDRELGALELRITTPQEIHHEQLVDLISERIVEAIR